MVCFPSKQHLSFFETWTFSPFKYFLSALLLAWMGTFDGVLHEHTSQESDRWAFGDYPGAVYVAHATVFV